MNNCEPGIIRECQQTKWVVVGPMTWRWIESDWVSECKLLSRDRSEVIGLLPPDQLDCLAWNEAFRLPRPCICNAHLYKPVWDGARWLSSHVESGNLYNKDGERVTFNGLVAINPTTVCVRRNAIVRFFKKWW